MHTGDPTDVTSTLTDLERKLVELERELNTVASGRPAGPVPAPAPAPVPAPVTPSPANTHPASLRVEDLRGEISELVRVRDQLEAAARELVSEYDRLVSRLQGAERPAPAAPIGARPLPDPAAVRPPSAPPAHQAPPTGSPNESTPYEGQVVVDAGPFRDIGTLQAFEQALARVDGARDVYVRSFEGDRAVIDVQLSHPVHLVPLLREQLSWPIIASEGGEGRLSVDVMIDAHGA